MSYQSLKRIGDDSSLSKIFNRVLRKIDLVRIISAPSTFSVKDHDNRMRELFYDTCLWEMYLHGVVKRLREWEAVLAEYEDEFLSSWKYYAASKRIAAIRDYGGDRDDYDKDGNVKTMITEKDLMAYSVIGDLYFDDWRDIVQDTKPDDLSGMGAAMRVNADISFTDMLKECFGKEIPTYKRGTDGNIVKMGFGDHVLAKISGQDEAEELISFVVGIAYIISVVVENIKGLPKDEDNKDVLRCLRTLVNNLLGVKDSETLNAIVRDFSDWLKNENQNEEI